MYKLENKYAPSFGFINWIGAWHLYKKEILRFLNVWAQTLFAPMISAVLSPLCPHF